MLRKIQRLFRDFENEKKLYLPEAKSARFSHYLLIMLQYKIPETEYFKNGLYDVHVDHAEYLKGTTKIVHGWNNSLKRNKPDATAAWRVSHFIDFNVSRILYPGLDARDYFMYEFYNIKHPVRKTFVTNGYLHKIDSKLNGPSNSKERDAIEDKSRFNSLYPDIITRKWIVSEKITFDELADFLSGLDKVIAKPLDGMQGIGIFTKEIHRQEDIEELYKTVSGHNYILEEVVEQHKDLRRLNPSSVNTVRVYSVNHDGTISITGAVLRIGRAGRVTDNYSTGGMAAEIDIDLGIVTSRAINYNEEEYFVQPDTHEVILGMTIPKWKEIKETVINAHLRIPQFGYVAWDVVVCEDGQVTFLEANTCGGFELQQHPCYKGKKNIYDAFMK